MTWKFWKNINIPFKKASKTSAVMATGLWGGTAWSSADYDSFAKETYMKNLISFACIDKIAKAVSSVPWKVYQNNNKGEKTENDTHPFNDVIKRANPDMSFNYFNYEVVSYIAMCGNAYLEKISPESGPNQKIPQEICTLRPSRMSIKVNKSTGYKEGYIYTVNGSSVVFPVDPISGESDILHMKFFNPLDDWYGMAITQPASREIDTSNASIKWNKNLMDNMGRPGMLLMFEKELTDKQYARLKSDVQTGREGASNAGKSMILEGARDAKPFGFNPQEMDWINSNLELARKLCIAWGVPPQLIGIPDSQTFSNFREARALFWEDTVLYYMNFLKTEYNYWLFPKGDVYLDYILDDIPALQYKRDLRWERAQKSDFLQLNEKRGMVGLDPVKGGDVILIPANMLPLGSEPDSEDNIDKQNDKTVNDLIDKGYGEDFARIAAGVEEYDKLDG